MLIFHEGLPGSGKSLAAMKDHVIPALKKGRQVWGYVEGWDDPDARAKIAFLAEKTTSEIDLLLHFMSREEVPNWADACPNDCMIVIDELQNFYPAGKSKLDPKTTQAVAEHRHKGQDILGMGQDLRDCHALFKRRVDQKVYFRNMDFMGMPSRYLWEVQKTKGPDKWEAVQKGQSTYDQEYFGTYKSHESATENKERFKDDRANVFKSSFFKFVLPLVAILMLLCIWHVVGFFRNTPVKEAPAKTQVANPVGHVSAASTPVVSPSSSPTPVKKESEKLFSETDFSLTSPQDRVQTLSAKYRLRVGGFWEGRGKRNGFVEWRDDGKTLIAQYSFDDLQGMGYTVMSNQFGTVVTLVNGPAHFMATMWPLDSSLGRANEQTLSTVKPVSSSAMPTSAPVELPPIPASVSNVAIPAESARPTAARPPSRLPLAR